MDPVLAHQLRRQWPILAATAVFVVFAVAHQALFQPAAKRYENALARARELGLALDPVEVVPVLPPRLYARIGDNTMLPASAIEQAASGVLAARLLEEITRTASSAGLDVTASEPGPASQQATSTVLRAHVTVRGSYRGFVAYLDALSRGRHFIAVDRFAVTSPGDHLQFEMWVSRLVLKRGGTRE